MKILYSVKKDCNDNVVYTFRPEINCVYRVESFIHEIGISYKKEVFRRANIQYRVCLYGYILRITSEIKQFSYRHTISSLLKAIDAIDNFCRQEPERYEMILVDGFAPDNSERRTWKLEKKELLNRLQRALNRKKYHRKHLSDLHLPREFDWTPFRDGVTGLGGLYDLIVQKMIQAMVKYFRDHAGCDPKYHTLQNIIGISIADNETMKAGEAAALAVCGDYGCTGYMMQCATQHAVCIYKEGWKKYAREMFKHRSKRIYDPK